MYYGMHCMLFDVSVVVVIFVYRACNCMISFMLLYVTCIKHKNLHGQHTYSRGIFGFIMHMMIKILVEQYQKDYIS